MLLCTRMGWQGARLRVPAVDGAVTRGGEDVAVAAPAHGAHRHGVAGHAEQAAPRLRVPHLRAKACNIGAAAERDARQLRETLPWRASC